MQIIARILAIIILIYGITLLNNVVKNQPMIITLNKAKETINQHQFYLHNNKEMQYLIPRTIYITHKYDLCDNKIPSHNLVHNNAILYLLQNIQRIKQYNQDFNVICFDDERSYKYIKSKDEKLSEYFKNEQKGMYKADIFRIVVLYYEGGYYFDADMEPMIPLHDILVNNTTFTSSLNTKQNLVFQSYLGSTKFNKILKITMEIYDDYYSNNKKLPYNAGAYVLAKALLQYTNESMLINIQNKQIYGDEIIKLLQEKIYDGPNARYLIAERKKGAAKSMKGLMQYAVFDQETNTFPLWSRFTGYQRVW